MDLTSAYLDVVSGQNRSPLAAVTRAALAAAAGAYRVGVAARNATFAAGVRRPHPLGRPTISIGNLTVGGTGKTPMVIELARRLYDTGSTPAVLLRGYRPGSSGSDEAALLTEQLGEQIPVQTAPSRRDAAHRVLATHPHVAVFLLDDGFQHRQAKRDLDIVLVDATRPFGFGHVLPRGLLREPSQNLRRADAVILTRTDQTDDTPQLDATIQAITGRPPVAHAAYQWSGFTDQNGDHTPPTSLNNATVIALCGIGNPGAFETALRHAVRRLAAFKAFPDHYDYNAIDVQSTLALARQHNADALVMTEKDWVKWGRIATGAAHTFPIYRPTLVTKFTKGDAEINALLSQLTDQHPTKPTTHQPTTHA